MAILVGVGVSIERDPLLAIKQAVKSAQVGLKKEKIALALVFSSHDLADKNLLNSVEIGAPLVGCSAAAIIMGDSIFKHGVAVMLLESSADLHVSAACVNNLKEKSSLVAGEQLGEALLKSTLNVRRDLGLIFVDDLSRDSHNLIYGLQERLGTSFPLIGAFASDSLSSTNRAVYFNHQQYRSACAGILWGGKINFGVDTQHGWKPLGKPRNVTKAEDNIVYEIDGAPAAKLYEEYLARNVRQLKKDLRHLTVFYPLGINLEGEQECLLRNISAIHDDGSLVVQGNIPQNSQVRLMIATKESCLSATQQALANVTKEVAQPDFLLVFSSISRYILLGKNAPQELAIIREGMKKNTPVIGLYTYAEQAPLKNMNYRGASYIHNQSITLLAIQG